MQRNHGANTRIHLYLPKAVTIPPEIPTARVVVIMKGKIYFVNKKYDGPRHFSVGGGARCEYRIVRDAYIDTSFAG